MRSFGRRGFLRLAAGAAAALALPGTVMAQPAAERTPVGTSGPSPTPTQVPAGELRLFTSPDHWDPGVIRTLGAQSGIAVKVRPLWDDAEAYRIVAAGALPLDLVTADGGWVTRYRTEDRLQPLDPDDLAVTEELFPMALDLELLASGEGLLGFPWSWSPVQVVCDPARLASIPDSWDVLVDPRNRGRVVIDSQRLDLVLCAGRATGARDPLAMTDAELATARDWLTRLRPNVRRVVRQRSEIVDSLASGACTLAIAGLGVPDQVLDAGGPELVAFVPREGTIGSLEAEVVLRDARNAVRVPAWIDAAASGEALAAAFLVDGRPSFNERALRLLEDAGHGDRARRYLYDRPETVLDLTLTGPGTRPDDYLAAYASVFGEEAAP